MGAIDGGNPGEGYKGGEPEPSAFRVRRDEHPADRAIRVYEAIVDETANPGPGVLAMRELRASQGPQNRWKVFPQKPLRGHSGLSMGRRQPRSQLRPACL